MMAEALLSISSGVVFHDETLIRMAVWFCQVVPPHQQVPSSWILFYYPVRGFCISEGYQHLVEHHIIQYLESGAS